MHTPCSPFLGGGGGGGGVECSSDYYSYPSFSSPQLMRSAGEGLCVMQALLLRAAGLSACVDVRTTRQT